MNFLTKIFDKKHPFLSKNFLTFSSKLISDRKNFPLWIPVFFGFGAAFYFKFLVTFPALICSAFFLLIIYRSFVLLACITFLVGGFYAKFYEKSPLVSKKIYVDVAGKIASIKNFSNPINHQNGANLLITDAALKPVQFSHRKEIHLEKNKKENQKKSKKTKSKKTKKKKNKSSKKLKKPSAEKRLSERKIKQLINFDGYQEIDREFIDFKSQYQKEIPQRLQKISLNLAKYNNDLAINDIVSFRALLAPPKSPEFPSSFDYQLDAKIKNIDAYGFVAGEVEILQKNQTSNLKERIANLRESIRSKIYQVLTGDEAAIALALLIGDQRQISSDLNTQIRNSGLSHLLSISGFHLSLAGAIFFISIRFFLSRSEKLALHFDLKKIAACGAIFAVFFYLLIANSPIPAQRAFVFVLFGLLALFFNKKLDAKRATMFAALILILANPYIIFSASFQLSFISVLVLISFSNRSEELMKFGHARYFIQILHLTFLIQIATAPFLMHHFRSLSLLGSLSNLAAIPLTSFVIMPLGFLAIFLMPLGAEKFVLVLMNHSITALKNIAQSVGSIPESNLASPWMPDVGLVISALGLLMICLGKKELRIFGAIIFAASFLTIFTNKNPDLILEKDQKFFAVFDGENLLFSKKLKDSKQRQIWMNQFNQKEFKQLFCEKNFCEFEIKNKKILALTGRNKIDEICNKDFDVMINMSGKYKLPHCFKNAEMTIDNDQFYREKTQFLFFENEKFNTDKIHRRAEEERNDESDFRDDSEDADGDL